MVVTISKDLEAQRAYVRRIEEANFEFGITVADAFIRGIRDMGYRSTTRALDELIDNSIQAEAQNILVAFHLAGKSTKPVGIAVIDDGHGMDPAMVRLSAVWGGTHREDDRTGFGRYGYGLPSACVSQGQRFTVYSRVDGDDWHAITLDLEEIRGNTEGINGTITMPETRNENPPNWALSHAQKHLGKDGLRHGTVIVIDKLDRLSWKTQAGLESNLLQGFAVTYRNYLSSVALRVNDKRVMPIDPLFITPGYRFFDLDSDRATALPEAAIKVTDPETRKPQGVIRVRYSSMPPTFAREDKLSERGKNNARFNILDENNGLIVLRQGRQIDVITRTPRSAPVTFRVNNDDRYWGCEIDVPATLDEEISITTSKQQVEFSDRIWELLKQNGVFNVIAELRRRYDEDKAVLKTKRDQVKETEPEIQMRSSEEAILSAQKFAPRKPAEDAETARRSAQGFDEEVLRRAIASGVPPQRVEEQLQKEIDSRPFRVTQESLIGAPFFRVQQVGTQKVLHLNTAHRFYQDLYAGPESTPRLRAAIEVLLWVIAVEAMEAVGERKIFYDTEMGLWSTKLATTLAQLETIDSAREASLAESDAAERAADEEAGRDATSDASDAEPAS